MTLTTCLQMSNPHLLTRFICTLSLSRRVYSECKTSLQRNSYGDGLIELSDFRLSGQQGLCRWRDIKAKLDHVLSLFHQCQYLRVKVGHPVAGIFVSDEQR